MMWPWTIPCRCSDQPQTRLCAQVASSLRQMDRSLRHCPKWARWGKLHGWRQSATSRGPGPPWTWRSSCDPSRAACPHTSRTAEVAEEPAKQCIPVMPQLELCLYLEMQNSKELHLNIARRQLHVSPESAELDECLRLLRAELDIAQCMNAQWMSPGIQKQCRTKSCKALQATGSAPFFTGDGND